MAEIRNPFKSISKIKIKSKKFEDSENSGNASKEWKTWQQSNLLDVGQLGYIIDKNCLVCGDGINSNVYLEDTDRESVVQEGAEVFIQINDLPRIPFVYIVPMYGKKYELVDGSIQESELIFKRSADDYYPVDGALLFLYDNYDDFDESQINPDDRRPTE